MKLRGPLDKLLASVYHFQILELVGLKNVCLSLDVFFAIRILTLPDFTFLSQC